MTMPPSSEQNGPVLRGVAASPGSAFGPIFLYRPEHPGAAAKGPERPGRSAAEEKAALRQALAEASDELMALSEQVRQEISPEEAGIFEAQAMMLQDPTLTEPAEQLIDGQGLDASAAISQAAEEQARLLESLENELLAARGADLRDALQRVLRKLHGVAAIDLGEQVAAAPEPVIVVARDLTPSDTARLRPEQVLGICTAVGGATAHAAILARALGIPAVTGIGEAALAQIEPGTEIGLDGTQGQVYLRADAHTRVRLLTEMKQRRAGAEQRLEQAAAWRSRPGATSDGQRVLLAANIGSGGPEEAQAAVETWGAEGVGLLRTEFLFGDRPTLPDEQEQFEQYRAVFAAFARQSAPDVPLVVRTLDAGADKPLPALAAVMGEMSEENPALGLRGIRIHLAYPDLLRTQIRALLRAAGATGVALHLMFPMIATIDEWRQARAIFDTAWQALQQEQAPLPAQTPVGIMVETPAAVMLAEPLAREVAFFSIGTNDLTQYVLAADRLNGRLGALYNALQPAVLRAVAQIVRGARAHGRLVAVCGEAGGDPKVAPLLVGLGVGELSMTPASIPTIKELLSRYSSQQLSDLAGRALNLATLEDVQALVDDALRLPSATS